MVLSLARLLPLLLLFWSMSPFETKVALARMISGQPALESSEQGQTVQFPRLANHRRPYCTARSAPQRVSLTPSLLPTGQPAPLARNFRRSRGAAALAAHVPSPAVRLSLGRSPPA